jgi:hypothetical protein
MKKFQAYTVIIIIFLWWACKKSTSQEPANVTDSIIAVVPKPDTPAKVDTLPPTDIPVQATATIKGKIAPLEIVKVAKMIFYGANGVINDNISISDDGSFLIDNIRAGSYYRLAINTGPVRGDATIRDITLLPGQVKDFQTIMIGLGNNGYTLYGNSTITGQIQPATAAHSVVAYSPVLQAQYSGTIDAGGNFMVKDLPEGQFNVSVNAAQYFTLAATVPKTASLTRNQTVDVGAFSLYSDKDSGSPNYLTYEVDGLKKYKEINNGANYLSPYFSLSTYKMITVYSSGIDIHRTVVADKLDIILDDLTQPGTYITKGTVKSEIRLTHRDITYGGISGARAGALSVWSTTASGGAAMVTITTIDAVNHTIRKKITNGVLANFKYSAVAP